MAESNAGLKRSLKLRDLIFLNIVAVYVPSSVSQNLPLGWVGLLVWTLAVAGFMLPYSVAIADLSVAYPREGGVYTWTRQALGNFHGFVCGWCYWVNTFLYVPSVFLAVVAIAALLGGERTAWLNEHPLALTVAASCALWFSALLHIFGLGQGKWLQNAGAIGRLIIAVALITAAVWKIVFIQESPAAQTVDPETLDVWRKIALWPFILNALVGLDLGSVMSEEAAAPRRDIPRSLLVGGFAVAACYLLTFSATLVTGFNQTNVIYGHILAVNSVIAEAGNDSLAWLAMVLILTELIGSLGNGAAWLSAPARVPFAIGIDHYLPAAFARVHKRFGTPYVALIVQAVVATILILINTYGTTLQEAYIALLSGSIVLVLVTYLYLFVSWLMLMQPENKRQFVRNATLSGIGIATTAFAMTACFIPPPIIAGIVGFELKIIGSVAFMLLCGLIVYITANRPLKQRAC
ncbi:MAG: APC family permease [Acidobacteria bacterium]|nr:APC family permease [Acidobacteriota bacterium]